MKGVDLLAVQELMGHKTMATTLRYAHLSPEHQLEAVRQLARPAPKPAPGPKVQACGRSAQREKAQPPARRKEKWRRAESNCGPRDYETLALAI